MMLADTDGLSVRQRTLSHRGFPSATQGGKKSNAVPHHNPGGHGKQVSGALRSPALPSSGHEQDASGLHYTAFFLLL